MKWKHLIKRYLSSINKGGIVKFWTYRLLTLTTYWQSFFMDIGKRIGRRLWTWHGPCRICSEVYRGSFPRAGLLSLFFHHSKGNWRHQSNTAVTNINKFSCCNTSQFKHFRGPSDLNSRMVFFFRCGHSQDLWVPVQNLQRASNYNPGNLEKAKSFHRKRRRRVVLIPFKLYLLLPTRPHGFEQVWSTFL